MANPRASSLFVLPGTQPESQYDAAVRGLLGGEPASATTTPVTGLLSGDEIYQVKLNDGTIIRRSAPVGSDDAAIRSLSKRR